MKTFDELFEQALRYNTIPAPENAVQKVAMKNNYNYSFNVWLQENKGWEHGNESQYTKLLTKENWKEFLTHENRVKSQKHREFERLKSSWQPEPPKQTETKQRKMKSDTRYWLTSIFNEQEQTKHPYLTFKKEIQTNGYFVVNTETDSVKVFTPELAVVLTSQELPVRNMDTKKATILNGWKHLLTYIEGYKEGEQYFEKEFKVSPDTLYGENAEKYVRDIHLNFFHLKHAGANEGWGYVKKQHPITLTHKLVKEYGYYSGIVNKVEEQLKKYPRLFATFDKCVHDLSQQSAMETVTEYPKTFEELFFNPGNAETCLQILRELSPPVIDATNNYIGKAKGVFPLWIKALKNHKPKPLIKHFKDIVYKELLNQKVAGLNLSKDASEFRKNYKRLEINGIELDIKTILSQYSQEGKLGK